MFEAIRGPLTAVGRLLLCTIFLLAALGNKIPHFNDVASFMASAGVPAPRLLLVGAIVFLIVGSLSVIAGYKARAKVSKNTVDERNDVTLSIDNGKINGLAVFRNTWITVR